LVLTGCENSSDKEIKYDVPLYKQGDKNLCWAYSQTMIESYYGTKLTQKKADKRAIEIAKEYHGWRDGDPEYKWNKGGWPLDRGERISDSEIDGINGLYDILEKNGPIYAYYIDGDKADTAHMVVITGVNISKDIVYTNNPQGKKGKQTYEEFLNGYTGGKGTPLRSLYLIK
jgi:hypothetical protein